MRRTSRKLLFCVMFVSKISDTLEIEHCLLTDSPIIIPRYGFHFRSIDIVDKPHSWDSVAVNKHGKRL